MTYFDGYGEPPDLDDDIDFDIDRMNRLKHPTCAHTILPDIDLGRKMGGLFNRWCDKDGKKLNRDQRRTQHTLGTDHDGTALPKYPYADPFHTMTSARKLDTALKKDVVEFAQEYYYKLQCKDINPKLKVPIHYGTLSVINQFDAPHFGTVRTDTAFLPLVILKVLSGKKPSTPDKLISSLVRKVLRVTRNAMDVQIAYNFSSLSYTTAEPFTVPKDQFLQRMSSIPAPLISLIEAYVCFSALIDKIPFGTIGSGVRSRHARFSRYTQIMVHQTNRFEDMMGLGFTAVWSEDICTISMDGQSWLLPLPVLYEIHNKIADHISVLLLAHFAEGSYLEADAFDRTLQFIQSLHQTHVEEVKTFFKLAGSMEALGLGMLIDRHDSYKNDAFIKATLADLEVEAYDAKENPFTMTHPMAVIMRGSSTPLLAELCCLSKLSGHPITSTRAGIEKLYERTTQSRTIQVEAVSWTAQGFKHDFLTSYFAQGGTYPKVKMTDKVHPRISYCIQNSKSFTDRSGDQFGSIEVPDFSEVDITEREDIDWLNDMLPYLKDTTTAIKRSHVYQCYLSTTKRSTNDLEIRRESKALLMYILCDIEELDHVVWTKEFGDRLNDLADFIEEFVIKLVPKEKELKEKARLFGCMAYKLRCANQVVLRYMQKYLRKYSPQQAMVLSELELNKKLFAFSKSRNMSNSVRAFTICIDAEAWNNAFTKETVEPVLRETMDPLSGTGLISRIHSAFEETFFYAFEKGSTIYYDGQNGGIEGLQQCSWMAVYTQQIRHALRTCPYAYMMIIKGDDVRVRFEVPKTEINAVNTPSVICEKIKKWLADGLALFGHKIKKLESYASESIFAFSKKLYCQEVALPSSYRQIQKTYGANNSFMFSLDDLVGAAFSNAHSSSSYGLNPLASLAVALVWSALHILLYDKNRGIATREKIAANKQEFQVLSDKELTALLLVPSAFGGFPIIHLHNMFLRAESDLISGFCGLLLFTQRYDPPLSLVMRRLADFPIADPPPYGLLVTDPYSLARVSLPSPTLKLQTYLKASIRDNARNQFVRALFSPEVDEWKRHYVTSFSSGDRLDPKLASAIYECSIPAHQERFLLKFASAKTMIEHVWSMGVSRRTINTMCSNLMRMELARQKARIKLFVEHGGSRVGVYAEDYSCPTQMAEALRDKGWKKPVDGITYPPPQHQTEIMHESELTVYDVGRTAVYEVVESEAFHPMMPAPHFAHTGLDAFLGNNTPSGTIASPLVIESDNQVVTNLRKLLSLATMCVLASTTDQPDGSFTFEDVCYHMIRMYTNLPVSELEDLRARHRSGTRTHHLAARGFEISIVPNMVKNMMTHARMNPDTNRRLRATQANYRINFLQLMTHNVSMIMFGWFLPHSPQNTGSFRSIVPDCDKCFTEIEEKNTYMTDRAVFGWINNMPANLQYQVDIATKTLEESLRQDEENYAVRKILIRPEENLQAAWEVMTEELFRQVVNLYTRVSTAYSVVRPTVERVQDQIHVTGVKGGVRSLTGSEILKIPASVIVRRLRSEVIFRIYRHYDIEETSDLVTFFANVEASTLPWAPVVKRLARVRKLQALVAEVCRLTGENVAAHGNEMRDYASVSRFAGRELAIRALGDISGDLVHIRVQAHIPAKDLHHRICSSRMMMLRSLTVSTPFSAIFPSRFTWDAMDSSLTNAFLSIVVLAYGPSWSVEDIERKFSVVRNLEALCPVVDVIFATWFRDPARIELRCPQESLGIMETWLRESYGLGADVSGLKADLFAFLGLEETYEELRDRNAQLVLFVKITFHDLARCYQLLRESTGVPEIDDTTSHDVDPPRLRVLSSYQITLPPLYVRGSEHYAAVPALPLDRGALITSEFTQAWPDELKLDLTNLVRPFGTSTTAWVKTRAILDGTQFLGRFRDHEFYAACLADGDGGDSRYVLETFPKCRVVWNSINRDLSEGMSQPSSLRVMTGDPAVLGVHSRAMTSVSMLESGDVTKTHIQNILCHQIPEDSRYSLVKEDADIPYGPERGRVAREIWFGTLRVFLKKGAPNGLLILKVFFDIPESVAWIVTLCRQTCSQVGLCLLRESHCSFEGYVLAQGPLVPLEIMPDFFSPPRTIYSMVYTVTRRCYGVITACQGGVSPRERSLALRGRNMECPPGFSPRYKSSLARFVVDDVEKEDPDLLVRRLKCDFDSMYRNMEAHISRLESTSTTDHTGRQLFERTKRLFHTMIVIQTLKIFFSVSTELGSSRDLHSWPDDFKDRLKDLYSELLESITSSPRWRGMGGPLTLDNLALKSANSPYSLKEEFEATLLLGFRGACDYYSYRCAMSHNDDMSVLIQMRRPFTQEEMAMRRHALQIQREILWEPLDEMYHPQIFMEREEADDEDRSDDNYDDAYDYYYEEAHGGESSNDEWYDAA